MLALALQGHAPKALSALSAHDAFGRPKAGRSGSLPTLRTGRRPAKVEPGGRFCESFLVWSSCPHVLMKTAQCIES